MATIYPAQIDTGITLPTVIDNSTPVYGDVVNRLRDAIIAIETELGIKPSGLYGTVKTRLDALESLIGISGSSTGFSGDLDGYYPSPTIVALQGYPLIINTPTIGQVLGWDGTSWTPTTTSSGGISTLTNDVSASGSGSVAATVQGLQGYTISTSAPTSGKILQYYSGNWTPETISLGGDLYGSITSPSPSISVVKIQGNAVQSGTPTEGQFFIYNGSSQWAPISLSGDVSDSNTTPGKLTVNGLQGKLFSGSPSNNQVPVYDSSYTSFDWVTPNANPSADVSGTIDNQTVKGLRGKTLASSLSSVGTSQDGYALTWVNANSDWEAKPAELNGVAITTTAPSAGGGSALPATPTGYATIIINGVARQIAYY